MNPLLSSGGFALFVMLLAAATLPAQSFPEPNQLPSRPDFPDPLVMLDGTKVATKEQWLDKRRPELLALFQHYMYGELPPPLPITSRVERTDPGAFDGKATLQEVTISFGPPKTPPIHLLLVVPNNRKAPAPVFVGMNFTGNHTLVKDPKVHLPTAWMYDNRPGVKNNRATEEGRGTAVDVWALEQSIDRGYAVATFYSGDVDPDRKDVREGIQPHLVKEGQKPSPGDWGTVAVWAWGIHRAVDYLVTDKNLDREKICVVGHSRLGKTALVAAAFDTRIALAIPHQAGCGGTAPNRQNNPKVESVKRINTSFPHWFNGRFKEFNDQTDKLPFDQHCLAALVAPRPLLYTNAFEDEWANPSGQLEMLKLAYPVYRLLAPDVEPPLGAWVRGGKHSMTTEDWQVFLAFADRHLGKTRR